MFGKTKLHHVIWNGMLLPVRTYFHSDPTLTRNHHMAKPHSHRATSTETTLTMSTVWGEPRKLGGRTTWAFAPIWAIPAAVKPKGPMEMN